MLSCSAASSTQQDRILESWSNFSYPQYWHQVCYYRWTSEASTRQISSCSVSPQDLTFSQDLGGFVQSFVEITGGHVDMSLNITCETLIIMITCSDSFRSVQFTSSRIFNRSSMHFHTTLLKPCMVSYQQNLMSISRPHKIHGGGPKAKGMWYNKLHKQSSIKQYQLG